MSRYMRRGISKARFAPTIANKSAPTTAEINAGIDLTGQMADISGFMFANSPIPTPDLATSFTTQIGGEDTADSSSFTFYEDDTSNPIRTSQAKGVHGYILLFPKLAGASPATGDKCEVWPVVITGNNRQWSLGNDPARYVVSYAIEGVPVQDATVA